jgi:hypothetical protein
MAAGKLRRVSICASRVDEQAILDTTEASMKSLGRTIGKKATKATVRHSVRGVASKAQRKPMRSATLLSVGGLFGAMAGWLAGRKTAKPA